MGEVTLEEIRYYYMNKSLLKVRRLAKGRKDQWHGRKKIEKYFGPPFSVQDQVSRYFQRKNDLTINLNYYSMKDHVIGAYGNGPSTKPRGKRE